ncbi:amino acid/amide ABC transporter membrane protein 1 (HAAT family) [Anoxybacillus vitaminiphilus]|uniref:Amino acid/amide ABC transporter membrane protein 1 (HAAT family) n=1 Tax=Paranoxybacillus vitaminiphilus TaxID=581036 RepID=A0A327Y4Q6_9BACL|nr:branched-chain amino acid ABC transporter permease [Anoxybacillus vitaminiphilus]RAK15046.1 amino acid/amide ABC transporter membrane protein 1 (HAAT family) [Anoxybacillus vitaminiphilus]
MDLVMQYLVTGLTVGSIYALMAIGFVTIYNITGILNFAQGEFAMIGALSCVSFVNLGLPMFAAIPAAIILTAIIGFAVERTVIFPVRNRSVITLIVITIGVSTFIKGLGLIIWGTSPRTLQPVMKMGPIQLLGAVINPQSLFIFLTVLLLLAVLYVFFDKTFIGSALRASEKNPRAASLMGINTSSMSALAFTLAAALGAIAGIMIAPLTDATYEMGFLIGLKGFVAMVIGGVNNISGAVVGGLLLGVIEAFSGGFISTFYSDAIAFGVLLLMLFFKPTGLFSKATGERV